MTTPTSPQRFLASRAIGQLSKPHLPYTLILSIIDSKDNVFERYKESDNPFEEEAEDEETEEVVVDTRQVINTLCLSIPSSLMECILINSMIVMSMMMNQAQLLLN